MGRLAPPALTQAAHMHAHAPPRKSCAPAQQYTQRHHCRHPRQPPPQVCGRGRHSRARAAAGRGPAGQAGGAAQTAGGGRGGGQERVGAAQHGTARRHEGRSSQMASPGGRTHTPPLHPASTAASRSCLHRCLSILPPPLQMLREHQERRQATAAAASASNLHLNLAELGIGGGSGAGGGGLQRLQREVRAALGRGWGRSGCVWVQ